MKKFISMVMAAAMVVSLVPATAFAAGTVAGTAKIVDDIEWTENEAETAKGKIGYDIAPELKVKITDADYKDTGTGNPKAEVTLTLDNADFLDGKGNVITDETKESDLKVSSYGSIDFDNDNKKGIAFGEDGTVKMTKVVIEDTNELTFTFEGEFAEDDVIYFNLISQIDNYKEGDTATVSVDGDIVEADDLVYASVLDTGIKVSLKKVAEVAEEETTKLEKELKIETTVGYFTDGQEIELKLNSGFEWDLTNDQKTALKETAGIDGSYLKIDENTLTFKVDGIQVDTININKDALGIEAVSAKVDAVAKITVKAKTFKDSDGKVKGFSATAAAVEAAKVVGDTVTMSVDEDEDLPVIYSGVNVDNYGITDDSDHEALKVTLKESVKEALDTKKSFTLTLPEGVYATNVDVSSEELGGFAASDKAIEDAFAAAYEKGDQETFEFKRKAFTDSKKAFEFNFTMTLIAEPTFEGDVTLTLGGDAFDKEQTVKIAKFVKPYTVEASQNDLIIDYRNTKVPTNVVVKEAEAGLWAKDEMEFVFDIEKMEFEDDVTLAVDDKSGLEVKAIKGTDMGFKVTDESDDDPATVTISDISLYMSRDIAAGAYDLELLTSAGEAMYTTDSLFTTEDDCAGGADEYKVADYKDWKYTTKTTKVDEKDVKTYVFDVEADTVKEGFVNIITAGRDKDDASFTTKVVVPVGESYMIAGEQTVALDVPAYVSASGYTMLPVRAVAVALGILNNNVLWDQASKTVTILYGQRIITMTVGAKVINVNGSAIPASSSPEVVNGRTFLPMRDLATALGVTDITWDAATKTATLNGNK